MIANEKVAGHAEHNSIGEVLPEYMFRIHKENFEIITVYISGHDLLFNENLDSVQYRILKIKSAGFTDTIPKEVNRHRWRGTLTGVREKRVDGMRKKNEDISDEKLLKVASRFGISDIIPNVHTFSVGGL